MRRLKCFTEIILVGALVLLPAISIAQSVTEQAFSPRQGATDLVIHTIGEARASIHVAAYSFTSKPIAAALIQAHDNGVDVEVVLDKSQRKGKHKLLRYLCSHGIPTRINSHYAIMHNKFMIIDDKILELGSFNYTKAAETKNAENVLILRNAPQAVQNYKLQWEKLWNEGK